MKKLVLLAAPLLLIGCVTDGAPAQPPPSTYRTLDPIASGALADLVELNRATPTPSVPNRVTPPPELSQDGTPWLDYLTWSMDGTQAQVDTLEDVTSGSMAHMVSSAQTGIDLTNAQIGWLASHDPQDCYRAIHAQHSTMLDAVLIAYRALRNESFTAPDKLSEATDEISQLNAMFDSVECI